MCYYNMYNLKIGAVRFILTKHLQLDSCFSVMQNGKQPISIN